MNEPEDDQFLVERCSSEISIDISGRCWTEKIILCVKVTVIEREDRIITPAAIYVN
jgi:hypothetical protein